MYMYFLFFPLSLNVGEWHSLMFCYTAWIFLKLINNIINACTSFFNIKQKCVCVCSCEGCATNSYCLNPFFLVAVWVSRSVFLWGWMVVVCLVGERPKTKQKKQWLVKFWVFLNWMNGFFFMFSCQELLNLPMSGQTKRGITHKRNISISSARINKPSIKTC